MSIKARIKRWRRRVAQQKREQAAMDAAEKRLNEYADEYADKLLRSKEEA